HERRRERGLRIRGHNQRRNRDEKAGDTVSQMKDSALRQTFILPGNSPIELRDDLGLPGKILSRVEEWILQEAARREDTWQFLLGVRGLPEGCYDFFRAGQSVSRALDRLTAIAVGIATLNRDLRDEVTKRRR